MANVKVTELPAIAGVTVDDVLYVVNDASGTPVSNKITVENFLATALSGANVFTNTTGISINADGHISVGSVAPVTLSSGLFTRDAVSGRMALQSNGALLFNSLLASEPAIFPFTGGCANMQVVGAGMAQFSDGTNVNVIGDVDSFEGRFTTGCSAGTNEGLVFGIIQTGFSHFLVHSAITKRGQFSGRDPFSDLDFWSIRVDANPSGNPRFLMGPGTADFDVSLVRTDSNRASIRNGDDSADGEFTAGVTYLGGIVTFPSATSHTTLSVSALSTDAIAGFYDSASTLVTLMQPDGSLLVGEEAVVGFDGFDFAGIVQSDTALVQTGGKTRGIVSFHSLATDTETNSTHYGADLAFNNFSEINFIDSEFNGVSGFVGHFSAFQANILNAVTASSFILGGVNGIASLYNGTFFLFEDNTPTIADLRGLNLSGWSTEAGVTVEDSYAIYIDNSTNLGTTISFSIFSLSEAHSQLNGTLELNRGGISYGSQVVVANSTYDIVDDVDHDVLIDSATISVESNINLPTIADVPEGREYTIKDLGAASSFNINIDADVGNGDSIDGENSFVIDANFGSVTLRACPDEQTWIIV